MQKLQHCRQVYGSACKAVCNTRCTNCCKGASQKQTEDDCRGAASSAQAHTRGMSQTCRCSVLTQPLVPSKIRSTFKPHRPYIRAAVPASARLPRGSCCLPRRSRARFSQVPATAVQQVQEVQISMRFRCAPGLETNSNFYSAGP